MHLLVERISRQLEAHFGEIFYGPAAIEEIERAEKEMGVEFPEDLKKLYEMHDGNREEKTGLFFGMPLLRLSDMVDEWRFSLENSEAGESMDIASYSVPERAIQEHYFNRKWLPIAYDHGGNYLAVDLAPGTTGIYGQVINYGRDEEVKYVVANSIQDFLEFILKTIEDGFYTIDEEESWSYSDVQDRHFLDALKDLPLPVMAADSAAVDAAAEVTISAEWQERMEQQSGSAESFMKKKVLYLDRRALTDISPLAACTDVRELLLSNNEIPDVAALRSLKSLKKLYIGGNPIASLAPLAGLENLQYLNISYTEVTDATPLTALGKLKELDMTGAKITDYHFLQQMPNLRSLSISIFSPMQLAALAEMKKLTHLEIRQMVGVRPGDLKLFSKMKNLKSLTVRHCVFRNLTFLLGNEKLDKLVLTDCAIEDAAAITKLPVSYLECSNTPIANIEILADSASLETFSGSFKQFWTLKQVMPRPVDFSRISGSMTEEEEQIWLSSLKELRPFKGGNK